MSESTVQLIAQPERRWVDALVGELQRFNLDRAPQLEFEQIFGMCERDDTLTAGVLAWTYGGWMFLDCLWVHRDLRGQGVGSALLRLAEEEAARRGCLGAHTDTFTFQALPFYEKHGYVEFGRLEGFTGSETRYYLKKALPGA